MQVLNPLPEAVHIHTHSCNAAAYTAGKEEREGWARGTCAHRLYEFFLYMFLYLTQALPCYGSSEMFNSCWSKADQCIGIRSNLWELVVSKALPEEWSWEMPLEQWVRSLLSAEPEMRNCVLGHAWAACPWWEVKGELMLTLTCQKQLGSKKSSWQLLSLLIDWKASCTS